MTVVVEIQDRNFKGSMLILLSCQGPLIKICFSSKMLLLVENQAEPKLEDGLALGPSEAGKSGSNVLTRWTGSTRLALETVHTLR